MHTESAFPHVTLRGRNTVTSTSTDYKTSCVAPRQCLGTPARGLPVWRINKNRAMASVVSLLERAADFSGATPVSSDPARNLVGRRCSRCEVCDFTPGERLCFRPAFSFCQVGMLIVANGEQSPPCNRDSRRLSLPTLQNRHNRNDRQRIPSSGQFARRRPKSTAYFRANVSTAAVFTATGELLLTATSCGFSSKIGIARQQLRLFTDVQLRFRDEREHGPRGCR